jgi:hypothetical protein
MALRDDSGRQSINRRIKLLNFHSRKYAPTQDKALALIGLDFSFCEGI